MQTRKFESGYSKLQKKKRVELFVKSQNGTIDNFIKRTNRKKNLMKILRMKLLNYLKSHLELIIFYIL